MQLIYGGGTKQSLPRFMFPNGFLLSCNPKHFSNAMESIENQLSFGKRKFEDIKIEFRLTTLKPPHAKLLVKYYNEIASENGSSVIILFFLSKWYTHVY